MTVKARAHVVIPEELVREIDRSVGKRKRSLFIEEAARKELQRLRQLSAVRKLKGSWKDEDHPEMKGGTDKWVRRMREADEAALRRKIG